MGDPAGHNSMKVGGWRVIVTYGLAVSGPALLIRAAMDAVKQWRYQPTLLNQVPVEVDTTIEVVFNLGN